MTDDARLWEILRDLERRRVLGPTIIAALRDAANQGSFQPDALLRDVEKLNDSIELRLGAEGYKALQHLVDMGWGFYEGNAPEPLDPIYERVAQILKEH